MVRLNRGGRFDTGCSRRREIVRLLAIALSLVLGVAGLTANAGPATAVPATSKTQLQYIVIPHPDDEYEAWSLVEKSAGNYPVFLVMTHGEETSFYDGHGIDAQGYNLEYGERVPQPQPWSTKWSATLHN